MQNVFASRVTEYFSDYYGFIVSDARVCLYSNRGLIKPATHTLSVYMNLSINRSLNKNFYTKPQQNYFLYSGALGKSIG
ncbi:MAG: hypothetical protein R3E08_14755 [Thiotrichaceae bacterium]